MADYTWIKGLLTLGNAPDITTFRNLGFNVVLSFAGGVAQPLGLGGAKMIPNGSGGAWGEEAKYNVVAYFMEDEPELKNISPDEILRRIRQCRSQTSLPITCIFTGYFYNRTENNWKGRYAEVIRELDFVCVDVYFYRYGYLRDENLNNAKKSIEIIQGLGKPVVGVAQGHEEARFKTTRPDIAYVDNFWRSRGCGVIWYAWNVGEGSIGSRGGIDDWYNQEIAKVNEGIVEEITEETIVHSCNVKISYQVSSFPENNDALTCPNCGMALGVEGIRGSEEIVDELPIPKVGWCKPTGYTDPSGNWRNETQLYDNIFTDDTGAYQDKNTILENSWGDFINLSTAPIWSNKIRVYPDRNFFKVNSYQIDIDVKRDGVWIDVFSGHLNNNVWNEKTFPLGLVTDARIRVFKYSGVGWTAKVKEFEFESQEPQEVITTETILCSKCGSQLELKVSSIASKNIEQYCPVCGEPAD